MRNKNIKMVMMCSILAIFGMLFCGCDKKNFWSDFDDDKKALYFEFVSKLPPLYIDEKYYAEVKNKVENYFLQHCDELQKISDENFYDSFYQEIENYAYNLCSDKKDNDESKFLHSFQYYLLNDIVNDKREKEFLEMNGEDYVEFINSTEYKYYEPIILENTIYKKEVWYEFCFMGYEEPLGKRGDVFTYTVSDLNSDGINELYINNKLYTLIKKDDEYQIKELYLLGDEPGPDYYGESQILPNGLILMYLNHDDWDESWVFYEIKSGKEVPIIQICAEHPEFYDKDRYILNVYNEKENVGNFDEVGLLGLALYNSKEKEISKDEAMKLIDEYMNKGIEVKRVVLKGKLY